MDFKGKKILITCATGGIGGSIVKKFLSLNATVLGTGTNDDRLSLLKNEFPSIITEKFDIPETFIAIISSFLFIFKKNQRPEKRITKGNIL